MTLTKHLRVENQKGIHARVAARIVKIAEFYDKDAYMTHRDMTVPLSSLMGLLLLSARKGTTVTISCDDPDSADLLQDIENLFAERFYED